MRKIAAILLTVMLISLAGCSQKEASVVKTYEMTDSETIEECVEYYQSFYNKLIFHFSSKIKEVLA